MQSISELKTLVASATDLGQPLNYFFDLMEDATVRRQEISLNYKKIQQSAELMQMLDHIENTISDFLGRKIRIHHPLLCFVQKEQFLHGSGAIVSIPIPLTIIYFADIKAGIFALATSFESTNMFRFCLLEPEELKQAH